MAVWKKCAGSPKPLIIAWIVMSRDIYYGDQSDRLFSGKDIPKSFIHTIIEEKPMSSIRMDKLSMLNVKDCGGVPSRKTPLETYDSVGGP
mmetsp:Transcript_14241/g.16002  ORF Transcript_14241/g.16002 Transcript_14241/m.16002 type:complete len:90 (+) Transcript_14241:1419-1688(+)